MKEAPISSRAPPQVRRDVDTDVIIPARYLNTTDPDELAEHCMEDADAEFVTRVQPGDIIVAGENFGCGSSREHAPIAIKAPGVSGVIAETFARIFYRNAINIGLPIVEVRRRPRRPRRTTGGGGSRDRRRQEPHPGRATRPSRSRRSCRN